MMPKLAPGQSFGDKLRSCNIINLRLAERIYPPEFQSPRHSHENAFFCLMLQGHSTETYRTSTRECSPDTLLFHPADEPQSEHFRGTGGHCFIVELESAWVDRIHEYSVTLNDSASFYGGALVSLAMKLYKEFRNADEASPLIVEGLMLEMVGEWLRRSKGATEERRPRWLEEVKELLHARFAERLKLDELARLVNVRPVHLAQTFRRHYQCSVGEYVRKLRIEFACRQLITSAIALSDLALMCGFSDQSHFTRTFKRHTGLSPAQFRRVSTNPNLRQKHLNYPRYLTDQKLY